MRKILFIFILLFFASSAFSQSPTINNFFPASGSNGTKVTIQGTYFDSVSLVTFGGVPAKSFKLDSIGVLSAVVDTGATGNIVVISSKGTATKPGFTYIKTTAPLVNSFSPSTGTNGTNIRIVGTGFTGTSSVTFGGIQATSYSVSSDSIINAVVGSGATGKIKVTNAVNNDTSKTQFVFTAPQQGPLIKSFSPTSGSTGTSITIVGSYFTGVNAVSFGGISAASFSVVSDSIINAVVGSGATGKIKVSTSLKTDTTATSFVFNPLPNLNTSSSFKMFNSCYGQFSGAEIIVVNGQNFISNLIIKAPPGVEISNATDTIYGSTLQVVPQNGNIINYSFSIRINNKTNIGSYLDTIKIYDGNSLLKLINLDFKVNGYPAQPTITRNQNTLTSSTSVFYKWIFSNSKILDSVRQIQIPSKGIYRVEGSTNKLCWTASNDYLVQADPTNNVLNDFELVVFPNPVPSLFYVQLKLDKKYSGDLEVTISDIAGLPKLKVNKYIFSSNYIKIPVSQNLTKGTYSVQVKINGYQIKAVQIIGL